MTKYVCDKKLIGKNMAKARSATGMTQLAATFEFGRSESSLSKVESGDRLPTVEMIFEYMNAFNVDANQLLGVRTDASIDSKLYAMDTEAREYLLKIFNAMIDNYPVK